MFNILVADDEKNIRILIEKYATFEGHKVDHAENGMDAINKARTGKYDIIIMDIMMPELDGFSAVREIRKFSSVPVLMLSARGEEYDRINGFEVGVDDYVVKPFSPKELMLRINAIVNRTTGNIANKNEVFLYETMQLDFGARTLKIDGQYVDLSFKEYELLSYMIKHTGIAIPREKLLSDVWGYDFFGDDRTLDTHIKFLRKDLGRYCDCIVTVRGVGYRFETKH